MNPAAVTIASILLLPSLAGAGEIYGKITSAGKPVGEGTEVTAKCGAHSYPAVRTDKTGSLPPGGPGTGKCTLNLVQNGAAASVDVVSYDEAAQADIALETKDGKLSARRR